MKRLLRDYGSSTNHCIAYFTASSPDKANIATECLKIIEDILANNEPYTTAHLAINGTDVMAAGIAPGREVGNTLSFLLERVIDEPTLNNKEDLLRLILIN